ncbi:MAG TPA: hypothetical protein DCZ59_09175, partial [Bacteroidetes bacterium]|nr:hypothetical protein [Bacteroidota bacterium]
PVCQRSAVARARCDGYVEQVMRLGPTSQKYLLSAEVDLDRAPCVRARIMVTEPLTKSIAVPGQRRIVHGRLRRTLWPTLPGEFSEGAYLRSTGCVLVLERASGWDVGPPPPLTGLITGLRASVTRRLVRVLPPDVAAVVVALVIGDRSMIDGSARQAYRLSGTAHIFSVSGSHVAVITWLVLLVIGRRPGVLVLTAGIMVVVGYTVLTGAEPPAVRSAIMGIGALIGMRSERDVSAINMLMMSVLAIVIADPMACISAGFGLSVVATLSLIVIVPRCRMVLRTLTVRRHAALRVIIDAVSVSWAATLGVTIPAAAAFQALSLASPLANLVVVPLLSAALLLGILIVAVPLTIVQDATAWWLTLIVRSADATARFWAIDVTAGLSSSDILWMALACALALAWPLVSLTWKGFAARLVVASCLVGVLLLMLRSASGREAAILIIERRNGLVVSRTAAGRVKLTIVGSRPGPIDPALLRWAQSRAATSVVGLGPWGRRMKGAILHDTDTTLRR